MREHMMIQPEELELEQVVSMVQEEPKASGPKAGCVPNKKQRLAHWIRDATVEELARIKGIGKKKAMLLKSGVELGKAAVVSQRGSLEMVTSPEDVVAFFRPECNLLTQECVFVLFLNTKQRVLGIEKVSQGTVDGTFVHPRDVFRKAIKANAKAVILVHNHPSGDPEPSPQDKKLTRRLTECGKILGIQVLDHVIIGREGHSSLNESNNGCIQR